MSSPRTDDLAAWDNVASEYAEQPRVDWFDGFIDRHLGDVAGKRILMVLMDIPDLSSVRVRVRSGGVLVATILHPAFFKQRTVDDGDGGYREVRGYLDEEAWWLDGFGGHAVATPRAPVRA